MNAEATQKFIDEMFDSWFVPALSDFVRVPNLTPMVDSEYLTNGLVEKCMEVTDAYIQKLDIVGLKRTVFAPEGKSPMVIYTVEPSEGATRNVMLYGHLDKQPWGTGWHEGLSATDPVIKGEYLYGRGSSDDGYSPFACLLAVKCAQAQGVKHPRIALVLETEEESGSPCLVELLGLAKDVIGKPDICFCMDSGAMDYSRMWITSSLRGICIVDMEVEVSANNYHSGELGGIIPESFRIARILLDRLDDPKTGMVVQDLHCELPEYKKAEADHIAATFGSSLYEKYNRVEGLKVMDQDNLAEMYLNNVWRPNLSITGADGLPPIASAGNVVRKSTGLRLSMRLPPAMDAQKAYEIMEQKLTTDVPYGAKVTLHGGHTGNGWSMKVPEQWLSESLEKSSAIFYGEKGGSYGMGGSIPFLNELEKMYPDTQILALGLLGPNANAHGPNESINLPYTKKLICCLSHVVASCAE